MKILVAMSAPPVSLDGGPPYYQRDDRRTRRKQLQELVDAQADLLQDLNQDFKSIAKHVGITSVCTLSCLAILLCIPDGHAKRLLISTCIVLQAGNVFSSAKAYGCTE